MREINIFFLKRIVGYFSKLNNSFIYKKIKIKNKSNKHYDPVTNLDIKIEKDLKKMIRKKFPNSNFIGEEFGRDFLKRSSKSKLTWIIDPIDGTKNFIIGAPTWGNLVGLRVDSDLKIGIAFFPILKKYYYSDGKNTFLYENLKKKIRLKTSVTTDLKKAKIVINTIDPLKNKKLLNFFLKDKNSFKISSTDALNYCLLAEGKIDIIIESNLKNVDIEPLIPIIKNSGGTVSNWYGTQDLRSGSILACSNRTLHSKMVLKFKNFLS